MTKENGGGAFPLRFVDEHDSIQPGMTLRDWFAGQALTGYLSSEIFVRSLESGFTAKDFAKEVFDLADAMLKERDK